MMKRLFAVALLLSLASACRSGGGLVEQGFKTTPTGPNTFVAHFQGPDGMSAENVRRNLLYHAARATLDRGDLYLIVGEVTTDRHSRWAPTHSTALPEAENPGNDEPGPGTRVGDPAYQTGASYSRSHAAEAEVTTFREKPADPRARDASRLMDEVRQGGSGL